MRQEPRFEQRDGLDGGTATRCGAEIRDMMPSGKQTICYWKWPIYSGFSHWKWWYSIVMQTFTRGYNWCISIATTETGDWTCTRHVDLSRPDFWPLDMHKNGDHNDTSWSPPNSFQSETMNFMASQIVVGCNWTLGCAVRRCLWVKSQLRSMAFLCEWQLYVFFLNAFVGPTLEDCVLTRL